MTRPARIFVEGAVYHVYNRVTRGEPVFSNAAEAERFVSLLRQVKERDELTVFAWVLMSNHYHLAVRTGPISLDRPMRSLQQRITMSFNARHNLYGPLWQGRYRAKMVEEQRYLDGLIAYIHLNPVAAGIADDPANYQWSGHRDLIGPSRRPVVDQDEVLFAFGETRRSARQRYVRALRVVAGGDWVGESPGRLPWWQLGRPPKTEEDAPRPDRSKAHIDFLGRSSGTVRPAITVEEFVYRAAASLGVSVDALRSRGRSADVVRARALIATLAVERYRLPVKALAEAISKSPDGVSRCVARGSLLRREDADFENEFEVMDRMFADETDGPGSTET